MRLLHYLMRVRLVKKGTAFAAAFILALRIASPASAAPANAFVLRTSAGDVSDVAKRHGLDVIAPLNARGVFLVTPSEGNAATSESLQSELLQDVEVLEVEPNHSVSLPEAPQRAAGGLTQSTAHILEDQTTQVLSGTTLITTYPAGLYAAGWGTSFSAPFVAGAAALLNETDPGIDHGDFADALSHGVRLSDSDFGWGRLDTYSAVSSLVPH